MKIDVVSCCGNCQNKFRCITSDIICSTRLDEIFEITRETWYRYRKFPLDYYLNIYRKVNINIIYSPLPDKKEIK